MKRITVMVLALTIAGLSAGVASAHETRSNINQRQAWQQHRVQNGQRCGQITRGEKRHLKKGQRHINRMERRGRRDGNLNIRERARIQGALDKQSHRIYRMRHNGRGV